MVSEVTRRHCWSSQQLFTWRRLMRQRAAKPAPSEPPCSFPPQSLVRILRTLTASASTRLRPVHERLLTYIYASDRKAETVNDH